jgi:hypothetical protein
MTVVSIGEDRAKAEIYGPVTCAVNAGR